MKISDILTFAKIQLENSGVSNSKLDSLILLSHTLSFSKEQVIFNPDFNLTFEQEQTFLELIKRRCKREPVSHLIGRREFYGHNFIVDCNVLDPRPDSETLIELVLKNFPDKKQNIQFLEIGCGSGCLMITLLKELENAKATAIDISEKALEIAQKNAELNDVKDRIQFLQSDLFSVFKTPDILRCAQNDRKRSCYSEHSEEYQETSFIAKFDLIISNPPYIPSQDIEELEPEVKIFEPRIALDGGNDGLDFYRKIAEEAKNFLEEKGKVILEIGINQEEDIIKIFTSQNFKFIDAKKDLAGVIRVLSFSAAN
ncbi:MAG: peptide chain release factor N(5)-glutamine methyltransferase [Pelagibacterales bacterium]|nr:peptide chain release factor N(5)-glutamine methyltransferase [Pelagibacterales bacterium]